LTTGQHRGRLELTWTNRDQRLIAVDDPAANYPYRWVPPTDYRAAEIRLLGQVAEVGEVSSPPNYLVRGDALHALGAFLNSSAAPEVLTGKVRLAYLDPPFRTGKVFAHYEDNLEYSIWLTLMRDRLEQVHSMLRPDGSLWVHCDDSMYGYLRVLLDQLFGVRNFIATFIWQKVDSPSDNKVPLAVDHDYILCYSRTEGGTRFRPKPDVSILNAFGRSDPESGRRYRDRLLKKNGKNSLRRDRWTMWYPLTAPNGDQVYPIHDDGREANWAASQDTVERWFAEDAAEQEEVSRRLHWVERPGAFVRTREEPTSADQDDGEPRWQLDNEGTHWVPYTREWAPNDPVRPWPTMWASSPVAKAQVLAAEAIDEDEFAGLDPEGRMAQTLEAIAGIDVLTDVKTTRQAKTHLRKLFPRIALFETPKPEELMERIITIASEANDLVLDCFAGSGSTLTTAHKLGRRWVGIEVESNTVETFALPRLTKVVSGEDRWGISGKVGWEGGGGFAVLDVGPSMFAEEEGRIVLSADAVGPALAEATAIQLGFIVEPSGPFIGRRGRALLAVIDGLVNCAVGEFLLGQLPEASTLTVCGTAVEPDVTSFLASRVPGSRARSIPQAILNTYGRPRRWTPRSEGEAPA
jgi:adenine-specific DNA-methyltransferase